MTVKELKSALCEAADDDQVLFCIPGTADYVQAQIVMTRSQWTGMAVERERATPISLTRRQQLAADWKAAYFDVATVF